MGPKVTTNLLKQLRGLMHNPKYVPEPISAYIVPSRDAHNNEYLAECDQFRSFITGFDGSAGTAVITEKDACLWTDGRYYLQASQQLDSSWTLMKEGLPTTPTRAEWLSKNLPRGSAIGVDPEVFSHNEFNPMQAKLESSGHKLVSVKTNLIELLWVDRPSRPKNPIQPLALSFSGKSVGNKHKEIVEKMKENNAQYLVLTALDEIAWFLNLRGSDIEYNPVFFAYVIVSEKSFELFIDEKQDSKLIRNHLTAEFGDGYKISSYDSIEPKLKALVHEVEGYIWFAESSSHALTNLIPKDNLLLTNITPLSLMKAVKNPVEIQGMRNCHIRDAAALCCYFAWLEKNIKTKKITEISGSEKLLEFRKMQDNFMGPSFETISSVGPHGAIIHYSPKQSTDVQITTDHMYLCDSGGQYLDGTTDVTRTLHFGEATAFEKECYTRVLKGQMKLASRIFPNKLKGNCLDAFARKFLWQVGLDYGHGTSHGIGSYLNVHEGPIGISWRPNSDDPGLEAGMFLSNEPGYYHDGEFGVRIEDIVQIVEARPPHNFNDRGFLAFETICLVPKMNKLILVEMLTDKELRELNEYHEKCRVVVGALLEKQGQMEAREWLIRETQPLLR